MDPLSPKMTLEDRGGNPLGTALHHTYTHTIPYWAIDEETPHYRISGSCIASQNPFSYWEKCFAECSIMVEASYIWKETARALHTFILFTMAGCV